MAIKDEAMTTLVQVLDALRLQIQQQQLTISELSAEKSNQVSAFPAFNPDSELWRDYLSRFNTYVTAHGVTKARIASFFLSCQSAVVFKDLSNLAEQRGSQVNKLSFEEIQERMEEQYELAKFVIRERAKYWGNIGRHPDESVAQLVNRIRRDASTCAFDKVEKPLDDALRIRFICSLGNAKVVSMLLKKKDSELSFDDAVKIATEAEDADRVAQETTKTISLSHGAVNVVEPVLEKGNRPSASVKCYCCGNMGHVKAKCQFKKAECRYCGRKGHLEKCCFEKNKKSSKSCKRVNMVNCENVSNLNQKIYLGGNCCVFQIDSGSPCNFVDLNIWKKLGFPDLDVCNETFKSASRDDLNVKGVFRRRAKLPQGFENLLEFKVVDCDGLLLIGRDGIRALRISVDKRLLGTNFVNHVNTPECNYTLQRECKNLCMKFPDLFKEELGCVRDFELEIQFSDNYKPKFSRPRPVPYSLLEDLNAAYDSGIKRGVWEVTTFCESGTPVVPVVKPMLPGYNKRKLRVCGDYRQLNRQLVIHRYPMPRVEELLSKLKGGCGYSKVDLADAYNQIKLGPVSQRRLALSTHRGVLLQKRLPFGITSAPGYFQETMDSLLTGLQGVAVYLDDILVSGTNAQIHLENLEALLKRLHEVGMRCRLQKCSIAMPTVEYLGHLLTPEGIAKGAKVQSVVKAVVPRNVGEVKAFLGSVQFYSKFLPSNVASLLEPMYRLTRKGVKWQWGKEESNCFNKVKELLESDAVLVHFNPSVPLGLSTDASEIGIGAVLFHRYVDGSERPILNISKILTPCQRRYSQVHREGLAVVYAFKKFHQFLFGRHFVLVTDHKPLVSLFSVGSSIPNLAGNRIARWALFVGSYDFDIEYRSTSKHNNADVLSRLPSVKDERFDKEEDEEDQWLTVSMVRAVAPQLDRDVVQETAKDPVLAMVIRYINNTWPATIPTELYPFRNISESLYVANGCLFFGYRLVIPTNMRSNVLRILHITHFGISKMKCLARSAVYWPGIDRSIAEFCAKCSVCGENQNMPSRVTVHPWMLPEQVWSRLHADHAISFRGCDWLVLVDALSKYPCIHRVPSLSSKETIRCLRNDFAHFGYPHALVTDNGPCFTSEEFRIWCQTKGICLLNGAPYHPATNGAAERLVQTFKAVVGKMKVPVDQAVAEFLMSYRRTPLDGGSSPSEWLNRRQIRADIDLLLPSTIQQRQERQVVKKVGERRLSIGDLCWARSYGTQKWEEGVVVKIRGPRCYGVEVNGKLWWRHINQLQARAN